MKGLPMRFVVRGCALVLLSLFVAGSLRAQPRPAIEPPAALPGVPGEAAAPSGGDGLTAELLYRILLGDIALQRGEPALAARAYLEAAREARDPRLARRAAEIAFGARQRGLTEQAAKLWSELDPAAERPRQILAALASGTGMREVPDEIDAELRLRLERFLADAAVSGGGVGEPFLQINRLFAQQPDKTAVYRLIRDLAQPYSTSAEAHFAVALAGLNAGLGNPAIAKSSLDEVDRALALRPNWDRAALLKAELLAKGSTKDAIAWLETFLKAVPDSAPGRTALAQYLVEERRYSEARALYQALAQQDPGHLEFRFAIAAISMEMKDYTTAEQELQALKRAGWGEDGIVETYLAQVAEQSKRYDEAIARYREVPEGERGWLARLKIATLMGKQGKVNEARRYLADLPAVTIEQRVQVSQAEAQILRDSGDLAGAFAALGRGLAEHPDAPDLIYDRAMIAEKLDKLDVAEKDLRHLLELRPEDPHALNALGYTLVDRTTRVDEGFVLIQKANSLAPSDPFILDSMGWALYRLGRLDDAIVYLSRALERQPDPEIAAHLGEVLWAKGQPERARQVWQSQLVQTPDNPVLLETVRRHGP